MQAVTNQDNPYQVIIDKFISTIETECLSYMEGNIPQSNFIDLFEGVIALSDQLPRLASSRVERIFINQLNKIGLYDLSVTFREKIESPLSAELYQLLLGNDIEAFEEMMREHSPREGRHLYIKECFDLFIKGGSSIEFMSIMADAHLSVLRALDLDKLELEREVQYMLDHLKQVGMRGIAASYKTNAQVMLKIS